MTIPITTAVFPVAGLGTRFLPATKASRKEMLPAVDKPLIQYVVEEALAAGIANMVFVTDRTKRSIEDHFDTAYELETELEAKQKQNMLELVRSTLPSGVECIYIREGEPRGLGHAVACGCPVVGDNPSAVILADDLIDQSAAANDPPVRRARMLPAGGLAAGGRARARRGDGKVRRGGCSALRL